MTYLITFSCYGAHLHGDEAGSVDRSHNVFGHRTLEADAGRLSRVRDLMNQEPYLLSAPAQAAVLDAIREVCLNRQWSLLAAHVRTTHVHIVVEAEMKPEKIMNAFKSYASRHLNQIEVEGKDRRRWARHGSTRWLNKREEIAAAIRYVVDEQGEAMAVWRAE